jgi:hypothetical protein
MIHSTRTERPTQDSILRFAEESLKKKSVENLLDKHRS